MSRTRAQILQAQTHTTSERNSLPVLRQGRLIWNGSTDQFEVYDGSDWQAVMTSGEPIDGDLLFNEVDAALLTGTVDGGSF